MPWSARRCRSSARQLAEAMDLRAGQKVLDIAAGNGNFTLAAARRWCDVTSTDYVESLLARGRQRAEAEGFRSNSRRPMPRTCRSRRVVRRRGLDLRRDVQPGSGPHRQRDAARVPVRRHASASPTGRRTASSARCSRRSASTCRRRPALKSPALWGTREWMEKAFGAEASSIVIAEPRHFMFRYRSPQHFLDVFRAVLRPDAQGVRGARRRRRRQALAQRHHRARSAGSTRPATARWSCRRISRSRRDKALTQRKRKETRT